MAPILGLATIAKNLSDFRLGSNKVGLGLGQGSRIWNMVDKRRGAPKMLIHWDDLHKPHSFHIGWRSCLDDGGCAVSS